MTSETGLTSQFIFNDGEIKSRLIKKGNDWYVAEWKYINDKDIDGNNQYTGSLSETDKELRNIWFPWIAGTAKWLGLNEQEKAWAKCHKN